LPTARSWKFPRQRVNRDAKGDVRDTQCTMCQLCCPRWDNGLTTKDKVRILTIDCKIHTLDPI